MVGGGGGGRSSLGSNANDGKRLIREGETAFFFLLHLARQGLLGRGGAARCGLSRPPVDPRTGPCGPVCVAAPWRPATNKSGVLFDLWSSVTRAPE